MKFFFTAGLQTATGDGVSNTSVKDMIAEIFKNEENGGSHRRTRRVANPIFR
ncbi:MAG: hypothetical protein ACLPRE_15590 [Limisphaerales bacterium]